MNEKVVNKGTLTSTRRKNHIYLRVEFKDPVMCKLDSYIKERCLHAAMPAEGSKCHQCMQENPSCKLASAAWHGGIIKFTPSPINVQRRAAKKAAITKKQKTRERIKRIRENGGKI